MNTKFDIIVIGSGPGGYTAAIRAAQLGYQVAIVEKYPVLGGTCTNVGCIPSKALLDSTEHYYQAAHQFVKHGINLSELHLDFKQFIARKSEVVKQNNSGLNYLMKKNKIQVFEGTASFVDTHTISVTGAAGETLLDATYFIIATGSKPATIAGVVIDKTRVVTSTEALSFTAQPKSLVIIGGGVIGVEMASLFARIGTAVTIVEYTTSLIPVMDLELGKALHKTLEKLDITIKLGSKVQAAINKGDQVSVVFVNQDRQKQELTADYCIVAVGRKAFTAGLALEKAGVALANNGTITVNENLQTSAAHIYAIGDVIKGPMLAHKAEDEGSFVAEIINGQKPHLKYNLIPNVVYTWPEVASVGQTEEELKSAGITYTTGKFPYIASARARASMDTDGFVKVLAGTTYGEVLGIHIIGPRAADVIAQAVIAMEYEVTAGEAGKICYAHPTYSEALKSAYLNASGQGAIDI